MRIGEILVFLLLMRRVLIMTSLLVKLCLVMREVMRKVIPLCEDQRDTNISTKALLTFEVHLLLYYSIYLAIGNHTVIMSLERVLTPSENTLPSSFSSSKLSTRIIIY